jgi:hypothetical protein
MAAKVGEERYVFEVDWYDQPASLIRKYLFTFYPADKTIEMVTNFFLTHFLLLKCPNPNYSTI